MKKVTKQEVEEQLGAGISDEQFKEALRYAKHKQEFICKREKSPVVLQHWYLVILTKEYVGNLEFSRFTMDLCRTLRDMEKEHLFNELGAPTDNHILADSAL